MDHGSERKVKKKKKQQQQPDIRFSTEERERERERVQNFPKEVAFFACPKSTPFDSQVLLGFLVLIDVVKNQGFAVSPVFKALIPCYLSLIRINGMLLILTIHYGIVSKICLESFKKSLRYCYSCSHLFVLSHIFVCYSGVINSCDRALEDWDSSPPCMADIFRCMGKTARAALSAIARHLRLRTDVFNHLLDDNPLPANEVSSSVLVATYSTVSWQNSKGDAGGGKPPPSGEVEKGLLTLISSDSPGLQVCDPNNRWYLADGGSAPGDLLLLTGKALSHATAGLRPAASYRASPDYSSSRTSSGRTSLAFRLVPQGNAILDCSPIAAAGHVIPQSYVPISVSQFMDDLSAEEDVICNRSESNNVARDNLNRESSLRSVLSDPLSGAFLDDAMVVSCGHSFGGGMLKKVIETSRCTLCSAEIEGGSLIPNHGTFQGLFIQPSKMILSAALRAAAATVKQEDERRLFHNAALRKRRKEMVDRMDTAKTQNRDNGDTGGDDGVQKGVQYPFAVNEKVVIKGNRRTPDKFVGKEAIITSQCLNGWYLLKIMGTGESVRLQYRSLQKILSFQAVDDRRLPQPNQENG
ncbi:hypothetical protein RHSIM_Rhsim09G0072600 [Rhododendron simsii]|uniref:PUB 62/63 C-terminal domain-containing protein n=1 Tax=Rhododendron simsii TaxID=118357 RepID=A0A834LEI2_RHOSS|nr:hypothetical protein RHSIM_Rhsim09G0072600 [Rhododendron simsii]